MKSGLEKRNKLYRLIGIVKVDWGIKLAIGSKGGVGGEKEDGRVKVNRGVKGEGGIKVDRGSKGG